MGCYRAWYGRFTPLLGQQMRRKDEAGKFAQRLLSETDSLVLFLYEPVVEPTNNRAERELRFGVLWRKRSYETSNEKGNHWVERILTVRQTSRLRGMPTFPLLLDAVQSYFQGTTPNLPWIAPNGPPFGHDLHDQLRYKLLVIKRVICGKPSCNQIAEGKRCGKFGL